MVPLCGNHRYATFPEFQPKWITNISSSGLKFYLNIDFGPSLKKINVFSLSQRACFRDTNGLKWNIFLPNPIEESLQCHHETVQLSLNLLLLVYSSSSEIYRKYVWNQSVDLRDWLLYGKDSGLNWVIIFYS